MGKPKIFLKTLKFITAQNTQPLNHTNIVHFWNLKRKKYLVKKTSNNLKFINLTFIVIFFENDLLWKKIRFFITYIYVIS